MSRRAVKVLTCTSCGCEIDDADLDDTARILDEVWEDLTESDRHQCAGCAEDTLDGICAWAESRGRATFEL